MLNILKGLNPTKAAGIDNLSGKYLKDGADILARSISQLCNFSIKLNSFPRSCKIHKLKPFFKKDCKVDPQSYGPISFLPLISKIIERIVHGKTEEFLSKNKILHRFQFEKTPLLDILLINLLPDSKRPFHWNYFNC